MDNDSVNDLVLSGLDQTLPLDKAQKGLLDRVDTIIQESVEQNDPDIAGDALRYLTGVSRISGLSLAKLIYTFKYQWDKFNRRDDFESYIREHAGVTKTTIKRYYTIWEMLVSGDIPKEYAEKIKLQPVRCLVSIGTMWKQGWEIEPHQWMRLSQAPDPSTVNKIIRDIKKVEPKKNTLQITMEEDGSLIAWKNDQRYFVGHLNIQDADEVVQQAIERIMGDGRVMTKESNL
jgi:hypothetical protein